jgi:hypothetical protein
MQLQGSYGTHALSLLKLGKKAAALHSACVTDHYWLLCKGQLYLVLSFA